MTSATASHPMLKPIGDIAAAHGFDLRITDDGFCVSPPRLPVTLNGKWLLDDAVFVYLYCRTTSWQLPGERTDANDWLSLLLAAFLRCRPQPFSASLWDVDHPIQAPATEIYARYLTLDQPGHSVLRSDPSSLADFEHLCEGIKAFEMLFPMVCGWSDAEPAYESSGEVEGWAKEVSQAVDEELDNRVQFNIRAAPNWLCLSKHPSQHLDLGVAAYRRSDGSHAVH